MHHDIPLRIGELAQHTQITVRTLHHYDEVGVLRPSGRTPAGHRVYTHSDLQRLQQIICLKDLGLALAEIRLCLDVDHTSLREVLESHRRVLEQRIELQQRTHQRLTSLLDRLAQGLDVAVPDLLKCIWEMKKLQEQKWSIEVVEQLRQHARDIGEEKFRAAKADIKAIVVEAAQALRDGVPPSDPRVVELALRTTELRHVITGGDPHLTAQLRRLNDEEFARGDPQGRCTDPAVIAYLEAARQTQPRTS